jgi:hypothetical protein
MTIDEGYCKKFDGNLAGRCGAFQKDPYESK